MSSRNAEGCGCLSCDCRLYHNLKAQRDQLREAAQAVVDELQPGVYQSVDRLAAALAANDPSGVADPDHRSNNSAENLDASTDRTNRQPFNEEEQS